MEELQVEKADLVKFEQQMMYSNPQNQPIIDLLKEYCTIQKVNKAPPDYQVKLEPSNSSVATATPTINIRRHSSEMPLRNNTLVSIANLNKQKSQMISNLNNVFSGKKSGSFSKYEKQTQKWMLEEPKNTDQNEGMTDE